MNLQIELFDHLRVRSDTRELPRAPRPRAQRLLAYLLVHRHRPLSREHIAFTLWPDSSESQASATLRRALSDLRVALPSQMSWIAVSANALQWKPEGCHWLDIEAFENSICRGTPSDLHEAVELYAGDLLATWDDEWIAAERERLRQLQLGALRRLVAHHRALGDYQVAISLARRALAHDPLAEAGHRDLIALLYQAGDRGAALAAYDHLSALLDSELDVAPMPETQALRDAILAGTALPTAAQSLGVAVPIRSSAHALPPLVGRSAELEVLSKCWEHIKTGNGRMVAVSGDAGVGKSRLMLSLADEVSANGGLALVGYCYEFEQALPYQAIVDMLRAAAHSLRYSELAPVHRAVLARLAPDVLDLVGAAPGDDVTADLRAQLFEALLQAFLVLARIQPLLLVIEDVHWAADSTLDWLTYIAPRLADAPVLVVITHRTDEIDAGRSVAQLRRRLARATELVTLQLTPLSILGHRELVKQLSGLPDDVAVPLADRLFEETAGNPFFLHEIVGSLLETRLLTARDGQWQGPFVDAQQVAALPLPESIRELFAARVERLAPAASTFIQVAAVAGRVFRYELVQHAVGWEDEPALLALDDLIERGFVGQREGQGSFAFAHHLVQEAIYAEMTSPRRMFWHRRFTQAFQALRPDDVEALAHHSGRAGDADQARVYYVQAGDRARQFAALRDAASYYRAALDRWPDFDYVSRAELLYKRGECQWVLGELHAALETFDESRALFETLGDRLRVGDIERLIGRVYWEQNERRASLEHYHRALTLLEQEPESVELARAISAISQMHMMAAEFDEAIVWGERALELATRLGAEDVAIHAQTNIGLSLVSSTSTERGLAMVRDSLSRALAANLVHDAMRIYFGLAEQFFSLGRYAEAHETYDALLAYAKRVQSDLFTGIALKSLVQLEWLTGRWTAALSHRQQLLIWMRSSSQPPVAIVWANRMLGTLHNDLGQAELARRVLELDLAAARSANELQTTVPHLAELARAYAALGREADAAGVLQELLTWVGRFPYVVFDCVLPLLVACWWFATQADSLDRDALGDCVTHLQRAAEHIGTVEAQAALAEGVGMALLAEGRPTQAAEQLQVAVVGWESLDRPYDQARALGALGITLQRAGQVSAARTAFDSALACYDSLATQLADPELKATFLSSPLVGELRITRSQLGTLT